MADTKPKVASKKAVIPAGIALDMENMAKDRKVKLEYEAGEKARKEGMGKIGFKRGGKVKPATAKKK